MLLLLETDNPLCGKTLNPHDPERSCGGSSGGEAVLSAIGAAGLGIGTDLGGSVRVPAAFRGVAALKPTAGRWPDDGRGSQRPGVGHGAGDGRGSAVLPIGVPLAAPPWQEARLLAALERLESERRMMDFPVR